MGLETKVNVLKSTDTHGRAREQVDRTVRDMLASMLPTLLEGLETPLHIPPAERHTKKKFDAMRASRASDFRTRTARFQKPPQG
jgi:hypothetical protein